MKLLALDTSTEVMSVAVQCRVDGRLQQWLHNGSGGAQASTTLIPVVMDLLKKAGLTLAGLDAICFGAGPGSFTGLRTACSVAQGLAYGAGVQVVPVDTLMAVAEEARYSALDACADVRITALLDARMDEMYAARYQFASGGWSELEASHLVRPEDLIWQGGSAANQAQAGNVFAAYGARFPADPPGSLGRILALPTAAAMLRLAPALLAAGKAVPAEQALPSYIRDKVAKTTAERLAEKAAAAQ